MLIFQKQKTPRVRLPPLDLPPRNPGNQIPETSVQLGHRPSSRHCHSVVALLGIPAGSQASARTALDQAVPPSIHARNLCRREACRFYNVHKEMKRFPAGEGAPGAEAVPSRRSIMGEGLYL